MQIYILICASIMAVGAASKITDHFLDFKEKYNKTYPDESVEKFRKKMFKENHKAIEKHNQLYERGKVTFKLAVNHLADMHLREVSETLLGFNKSLKATNKMMEGRPFQRNANEQPKKAVDWRDSGAVSPVKDQGKCGSCWAFSANGALEGHHFLKKGKMVILSEQNLIDCSSAYGNNGCQGGLMEQAFQYVKENQGVDTESSYPYEGKDNECRFVSGNVGATDAGFGVVPSGDEEALMEAVSKGPVSAAIDASYKSFMLYSEGVYNEPSCSNRRLNHGVLIIGYGTTPEGIKYWLVKNSWGVHWGEKGYIKIARNSNNTCGIATESSFPLIS